MEKSYLKMTDEEFDKYYLGDSAPLLRECHKDDTPNELRTAAEQITFDYYGAMAEHNWLIAEAERREKR